MNAPGEGNSKYECDMCLNKAGMCKDTQQITAAADEAVEELIKVALQPRLQ